MRITRYIESDTEAIVNLFYETVHSINAMDYSPLQLNAWAPKEERESKIQSWKDSLSQHITFVAKIDDQVVGFSDLTHNGHLDRLFIHKDYQGQGIAKALVDMLESEARKLNIFEIDTEASITAKPFFEHRGYKVVFAQTIERKGVKLNNFKMMKKID